MEKQLKVKRVTVEERAARIIRESTGCIVEPEHYDSDLMNIPNYDSLSHVEVIMGIEEEFGIEIPDEEFEHIKTLNDMVRKVK